MATTKMRWFSRFSLQTTTRIAYKMLVDRNKRALSAEFVKDDEKILMLFARSAEKVELLRKAANLDEVAVPVATVPVRGEGPVPEIGDNDRGVLQMGARCALKTMKRNKRNMLVCEFSEPVVEPVLLLYARGADVVDDIVQRAYAIGLLDRAEQQAA